MKGKGERPAPELCEAAGRVEWEEEKGVEEACEGCKCGPVTSGWWGTWCPTGADVIMGQTRLKNNTVMTIRSFVPRRTKVHQAQWIHQCDGWKWEKREWNHIICNSRGWKGTAEWRAFMAGGKNIKWILRYLCPAAHHKPLTKHTNGARRRRLTVNLAVAESADCVYTRHRPSSP